MGTTQLIGHSSSSPFSDGGDSSGTLPPPPSVDERLVYLIACLNAVHGDGYDFSFCTEQDFLLLDPRDVVKEINELLVSLPKESCGRVVAPTASSVEECQMYFWEALTGPLGGVGALVAQDIDVFRFACPDGDPIAARQTVVWSSHYFMYSRRQRVIVSLLCYGEGNLYRGDDGAEEEIDGNFDGGGKNRYYYWN